MIIRRSLILVLVITASCWTVSPAQPPARGRFVHADLSASIPLSPDTNPLFGHWLVGVRQPLAAQFLAKPSTVYQVFLAFSEAYWNKPGQRLMDLEVGGKIVATVDAFQNAKGTPSGYLLPARTDAQGRLLVRICPHRGAPDQNPVVCGILLFPADAAVRVDAVIHGRSPEPLVALLAKDADSHVEDERLVRQGRVDTELTETYGTCVLTDFRHHSWLAAESWDVWSWQSVGFLYAANDENYQKTFGPRYQMKLELLVDGQFQEIVPEAITQQFDCRTTVGKSANVEFHSTAMILASLQWALAWQCRNQTDRPVQLEYRLTFSDRDNLSKRLAAVSDQHVVIADSFIPYLAAFDRKPQIMTNGPAIVMSWKGTNAPQEASTVSLAIRSGWGDASVDQARSKWMNYNLCAKLDPTELRRRQETEFRSAARLLGHPKAGLNWDDLRALGAAKQQRLEKMLPGLTGLPAAWQGLWAYTLDLLRAGTKPPQGLCSDIWMAGDLHFYLWTFYWDTALSAHAYCHADADAAARVLLNFLRTGIRPDGSTWLQFNPVQRFPNDRPQLLNIPMALWDSYQITRDKARIAEAYPLLERHQDWIDRVWNKRPNGPIADLDWNIDYGCDLHKERHLWLDMTTFQVAQYEYLAKMARLLDKDASTVAKWESKAAQLKDAINRLMWNEADGAYYCLKARNLEQTKVSCPIEFYTLTTGVASPPQAQRLMKRLLDPDKYAPGRRGNFFCPSVSYDDPSFKVVPDGAGGWGGNIWLVEPYYTVRGLARYGLQQEAALVTSNLYVMAASEYLRTGSLWEQYNPATGEGIHLKYFTSGIASTIVDMLLRGVFGFERTDDPLAFYFTPRPVQADWQGIENLALSGNLKLTLQVKATNDSVICKVAVAGLPTPHARVEILKDGNLYRQLRFNDHHEAEAVLAASNGSRYLPGLSDQFTVRSPEFFAEAYQRTPTVLELEHYSAVKKLGNWEGRPDSLVAKHGKGKKGPDYFRGALERLHASYIGYHGYAHEWLADNPELTKELLNRCGYWLFPKSIDFPEKLVPGTTAPLVLTIENRGVAPPYAPYELQVRLSGPSGVLIRTLTNNCRSWLPGPPVSSRCEFKLPSDLKPGTYTLALGLFDLTSSGKERPVEFALKITARDPDGYYRLAEVEAKSAAINQDDGAVGSATRPNTGAGAMVGDPAIQEVLSGQRAVAEAHWWGFDPADATQALQSAIRSGAKTVRVRKMSGPWIVDKIELASDQELIFEPGVVVLAKAGAFRGQGDSLFTAASRKNIRLTGLSATLQMRRADYDAPPYRKAEWRHVLNLHSCTNVTVTGLTLTESGGDGIYLGVDRSGGPNRDIVIRHVVCERNYRQGISVISAENLLIEDCVLNGTAGTAPEAGIDFEPNGPTERLVNCVMRRCISENNRGLGYHFYLNQLDASSAPISVRLEDCVSRGTNSQSVNVSLPMSHRTPVPGQIEFVNCRFADQGRAGITITKPAAGAGLRFENCRLADPAPAAAAPIRLQAPAGSKSKLGGIQFVNFQFEERMDRPLIDFPSQGGVPLAEVSGELIRHFAGRTERTVLDPAWLAKVSPPDPLFEMPTLPLNLAALPQPASWTAPRQLPPHRLRGTATLGLSVGKNERVRLALRFLPVGRAKEAKPLTAAVLDTSGKTIYQFSVKLGEEAPGEFTSRDAGVYRVRCEAGQHTASVTSSSHPVCLLGDEGTFHFISTAATFSFLVPRETREFGLRLTGEGTGECVKASIFDPSGRNVWGEEAIGQPRGFIGKPGANAPAGWWQLRLEKPTRGVFEDHYVELRGIPTVLFFDAPASPLR